MQACFLICGSEREVLISNGMCKEIPAEIYEKEYGSEEQIKLPSMEERDKRKTGKSAGRNKRTARR